jgi:RNA recognition motif-containing protein
VKVSLEIVIKPLGENFKNPQLEIRNKIFTTSKRNVTTMSTRIIIKNLPHNITPSRLKSHFSTSQAGSTYFSAQVTDTNLLTDPKSGKSRGFAFVGYRSAEQAQQAVEWFNGTFIDQRKIVVEVAKRVFFFGGLLI